MYVKGTECSELCVCMLNLVFLNHMQGEWGTSLNSVHANEKADVRDVLDCDYKVIAQIVNMLLDPISSKQRQLGKWALVSHCQLTFYHLI